MPEKKVFCEHCRKDVPFTIHEKKTEDTMKGEKYCYIGKEAYCLHCKSAIYVAQVNDFNLKMLYDAYRKKNDIVSLAVILEIPKKYAIGKRPLSLLLGWGEQTFSRYCDGDMPTKQYSEILQKLYDDPAYYDQILESNKNNLKADTSYTKSKKAVNELLGRTQTTNKKIDLAVAYLLNECKDITPLALQKALYYVQGFYYAFYNTFLFSEECEAWVHGPVYRDIYVKYRNYRFDPIKGSVAFDNSVFSCLEKSILDSVINYACCYSAKVLESLTHSETPWLSTRGELSPTALSNRTIDKTLIGNYFCTVKAKYNMVNPNDIKAYTETMFKAI